MEEEHPAAVNDDASTPIPETDAPDTTHQSNEPQTDNMEVHHHPDLHHRKKRWKEYFLEFLMIFLAVTLGFLAENLREHISEKGRAGIFAKSLYEDFRTDTTTLHQLIDYTVAKINNIDSLETCLRNPRGKYNDSLLYKTVLYMLSTFQFDNINGTYEQIKNSGSLRFFNQDLVNELNNYDATSLKLKLMEDWENKFLFEKAIPQTQLIFNFKVFNDLRNGVPVKHEMYVRNLNGESIDLLVNQGELVKRLRERQLLQQKLLLDRANHILSALKKEYHL